MAIGGLGSGLDSLFSDNTTEVQVKKTLRITEIEPNREQPRKNFSDEAITALAESIRDHGMLQPILVRPMEDGSYRIVAGERRWRAARMLGLDEVPVNIKEMTDTEAAQLIEKYGMTQDAVAKTIGRSRSSVSNSMRILALPDRILNMVEDGELSLGHAKALLSFENEDLMIATAVKAANGGLTVRQVERAAQKSLENEDEQSEKSNRRIDNYFVEVELSLKEALGRKVKVDYGKNKGALTLEFYDKDDLAAIVKRLAEE